MTRNIYQNPFDHPDPQETLAAYLAWHSSTYDIYKNEMVRRLCPIPLSGLRCLDIGCAAGLFSIWMAKQGATVVGVEQSTYSVQAARLYARQSRVEDRCQFINIDISEFESAEDFDFILAKDVIEHIADDRAFVDRIYRLLRPGGWLVIATQNSFSLNYLVEGIWRRHVNKEKKWMGWDETHVRFYTPWSLKNLLTGRGFIVEAQNSTYHFPYRFLARLLPPGFRGGRPFHILDFALGHRWPLNITGWSYHIRCRRSG